MTERSHSITHNNLTSRSRNVHLSHLPSSLPKHHQQVDKSFTCSAHVPVNSLLVSLSPTAMKGKSHFCGSRSFPVSRKLAQGCWMFGKFSETVSLSPIHKLFPNSSDIRVHFLFYCERSDEDELKEFEDFWAQAN